MVNCVIDNFTSKMESYEACMRVMFEDFSHQLYDKVCASVQELCYGCEVGKLLLWYYTVMLY